MIKTLFSMNTENSIDQTIKDHEDDFISWIKDNIEEAYSNPKIKTSMTIQNIRGPNHNKHHRRL